MTLELGRVIPIVIIDDTSVARHLAAALTRAESAASG